jgi:glycosyltransferase involved in cell wall biosynthesis
MPHQKAVALDRLFAQTRPVILLVSHNWGGGVEKHVKELVDFFTDSAVFLVLRPEINDYFSVSWENKGESLKLCFRLPSEYDLLKSFFKQARVCRIHFHHLINVPGIIHRLPEELSIPGDVTLHDYYLVCPNIFLVDENERYCGEKGELFCRKCAVDRNMDIHAWRKNHHAFLKSADRIFAPSWDMAVRFKTFFDDLNILVAYHPDHECTGTYPAPAFPEIGSTEALRVVVVGNLGRRKGAEILSEVSVLSEREKAPLAFHLVGDSYRKLSEKPFSKLTVYGSYTEETLAPLLKKINPHIAWIPAMWPETYSYVLSELMAFGVPIAATRIGAFPERLNNRSLSWLMDWDTRPSEWMDFFLGIRKQFIKKEDSSSMVGGVQEPVLRFSYRTDYLSAAAMPATTPNEDKSSIRLFLNLPSDVFNEADYLSSNPDIAEQVMSGRLSSGREHWWKYGKNDNRKLSVISGMSQTTPFLVSIIIRTKDRYKLLIRALMSIAVQTYRPIEVVLVNDGGCDLDIEKLKGILGKVSLNYIVLKKTAGRAHARNIGINSARGKYVGFLDDDAIYYKDAIRVLCSAMDCGGWPVVYGQAILKFHDEKGLLDISKKDALLAFPFDRDILLYRNEIPFNALLFDERLFHDFGPIDESLTGCEEWDFLLNIADKYFFKYIPEVVVEYCRLGASLDGCRLTEREIRAAEEKVRLKRLDNATVSMVTKQIDFALVDSRNRIARYASEKIECLSLIAMFESENERMYACLQECRNEVKKMQNTISWRITIPIRAARYFQREITGALKSLVTRVKTDYRKADGYIRSYGVYAFIIKIYLYIAGKTAFDPDRSDYDYIRPKPIPHHHVYNDWLQRNGATERDLINQRHEALSWSDAPLISLIVSVYNLNHGRLDSALKSIYSQSYHNWDATIVSDLSTDDGTVSVINKWVNIDARFKEHRSNRGVAAASQDGLSAAKGGFVAVLDPDGLLEPDALYYIAKKILENQDVDVIYSDEILVDGNENVFDIVFRSDFSIDDLLSRQDMAHFMVYRKEMGMAVGACDLDDAVTRDHEFLLKIASKSHQFQHVPRPLYRSRRHPAGSHIF